MMWRCFFLRSISKSMLNLNLLFCSEGFPRNVEVFIGNTCLIFFSVCFFCAALQLCIFISQLIYGVGPNPLVFVLPLCAFQFC